MCVGADTISTRRTLSVTQRLCRTVAARGWPLRTARHATTSTGTATASSRHAASAAHPAVTIGRPPAVPHVLAPQHLVDPDPTAEPANALRANAETSRAPRNLTATATVCAIRANQIAARRIPRNPIVPVFPLRPIRALRLFRAIHPRQRHSDDLGAQRISLDGYRMKRSIQIQSAARCGMTISDLPIKSFRTLADLSEAMREGSCRNPETQISDTQLGYLRAISHLQFEAQICSSQAGFHDEAPCRVVRHCRAPIHRFRRGVFCAVRLSPAVGQSRDRYR